MSCRYPRVALTLSTRARRPGAQGDDSRERGCPVNNNSQYVASQLNAERALRHVCTGISLLAPMSAGVDATGVPSNVSLGWQGARKRFTDAPTQVQGSPQSRGRLAHT